MPPRSPNQGLLYKQPNFTCYVFLHFPRLTRLHRIFIWYLAAENAGTRRAAGLAAIAASLLACGIGIALYPIHLGLDLKGGTEFLLQVQGDPGPQALDQAVSVIRKRLDTLGTREISIVPEGKDRLKIQIPGLQGAEVDATEKLLSQVAKLEFKLVPPNSQEILAAAAQ